MSGPRRLRVVAGGTVCRAGPGALQGAVTAHRLPAFGVRVEPIQDETTSFQVCGRYATEDAPAEAKETGEDVPPKEPATARRPVRLVPGPRQDHRPDGTQGKGGLAVSPDGGVPVMWEAQDGTQADVRTSVASWLQVTARVGRTDVWCVGDGPWATQDTWVASIQHQGRVLAPLPGDAGMPRQREAWVLTNTVEDRIPWREATGTPRWSRGVRRPSVLRAPVGRQSSWEVHRVCHPRVQAETPTRLGTRALPSREASAQLLDATLQRDHPRDVLTSRIVSTTTPRTRDQGRGRPGASASDEEAPEVHGSVEWPWLPDALEHATWLGGSCPVRTHDPTLTTASAGRSSPEPYHPEPRFTWLHGAGIVAPVLLTNPPRIEAFVCVGGRVRQRLTLVARAAAHQIAASGTPVMGLNPTRLPDYRPTTEARRHVFRHVTVTPVVLAEPPVEIVIRPLHALPVRVLHGLGLEDAMDTLDSLDRPRDELETSSFPVHHADERNVSTNARRRKFLTPSYSPLLRGRICSAPWQREDGRGQRLVPRCTRAPRWPASAEVSASRRMCRLYAAVYLWLTGFFSTSESGGTGRAGVSFEVPSRVVAVPSPRLNSSLTCHVVLAVIGTLRMAVSPSAPSSHNPNRSQ